MVIVGVADYSTRVPAPPVSTIQNQWLLAKKIQSFDGSYHDRQIARSSLFERIIDGSGNSCECMLQPFLQYPQLLFRHFAKVPLIS